MKLVLLASLLTLVSSQGNRNSFVDPNNSGVNHPGIGGLVSPSPSACSKRIKHANFRNHAYYMSWLDTPGRTFSWLEGRNFCRQRCMDLVSLESIAENEFIKRFLSEGRVEYIWTSGRKCNFAGCDARRPNNIFGWFWSATGVKLPPTNAAFSLSDWGRAGYFPNIPQPDNRQLRPIFANREDEACLAILNPRIYNEPDGKYHWHDVACRHKKSIVCEDNDRLLRLVRLGNP